MTFTEEDASNDGLIKREVGKEMKKVAQTQNPEVYEHFARVCEEIGRDPADVFGEMAVRSLNSEEYANNIFNSEITMKQLRADEIRLEDVKYVKKLSDELGLNETDSSEDPIDQLINQRLQSITRSPIPRLREQQNQGQQAGGQSQEQMGVLLEKINQLEQKVEDGNEESSTDTESETTESQSVDDLFGGNDEQEEQESVQEQSDSTVSESVSEPAEDEGPTEEEIEEALDGAVEMDEPEGSVEEYEDSTGPMEAEPDNPFSEAGEEVIVENQGHDVEAEEAGEEGEEFTEVVEQVEEQNEDTTTFSSEEAEEE